MVSIRQRCPSRTSLLNGSRLNFPEGSIRCLLGLGGMSKRRATDVSTVERVPGAQARNDAPEM
jgi:hypothetical protein